MKNTNEREEGGVVETGKTTGGGGGQGAGEDDRRRRRGTNVELCLGVSGGCWLPKGGDAAQRHEAPSRDGAPRRDETPRGGTERRAERASDNNDDDAKRGEGT
ncbi:unnamed protein product [Lampetra planeri]